MMKVQIFLLQSLMNPNEQLNLQSMNELSLQVRIFYRGHLTLGEAKFFEDRKYNYRTQQQKDNYVHHELHSKNGLIPRSFHQNRETDSPMTDSIHELLDK